LYNREEYVVEDAIKFVASHAISTEKINSDKMAVDYPIPDEQQPIGTTNTDF
jgi:hypothetical protein